MGTRADGARLERMKASSLWAGDRFQNVHPVLPDLRDPTVPMPSLKDFMCGGERRVPQGPLPSISPLNAWAKKPQSGLRVTWLGHSTILIEIDGVRILTDPVWGPRASPSALVGPKRFQPHAWDQPAERLLELAPHSGAQLLMPLLGQPVEPAHAEIVKPWWREVENAVVKPAPETEGEVTLPTSVPWPLD